MSSVSVNSPKTPVTEGSHGIAAATLPNVCKMPGPPAPFVPTPLPNIGKSNSSPKDYSKTVVIEGSKVAIKGATFKSIGDIASQGTGGGLTSSTVEGVTCFAGPGALDVMIEGKNVQLLSDPMLNNCGPGGSPANAATAVGLVQDIDGAVLVTALVGDEPCPLCRKTHDDEGKLEETQDTQGAASELMAAALPLKVNKMLGIVRCQQGRTYAGNSGLQLKMLQDKMPSGWHAPMVQNKSSTAAISYKDRFLAYIAAKGKDAAAFAEGWALAENKMDAYNNRSTEPGAAPVEPSFLPGGCAAPKLVLLALQHGCRPVALTERRSKGAVEVFFRTHENPTPRLGSFAGERAVPPCGTCQILLTMLMCPDSEKPQCSHTAPGAGVCNKC